MLWLVYLDSTLPKSRGRIVPRRLAVAKPTIEEVAKALDKLGLKYEVYGDKKYPAIWYDDRGQGYFVVYSDLGLRKLAASVAQEVKALRGKE
ncbi:MAG: signal recognition particle subunit SRP19/SEC65 family protein [Thermoproteus sp. AZ2]|uniref:Signal recognition particle subunit SRP19/SEC65 family protein n=1 Tax=Thermoproteus sp. AZ2 TaxID=1609232 RepID=A0ACC6V082_9CREN